MAQSTKDILGGDPESLLDHTCKTVPKEQLHLPGPDFVDRVFAPSDRNNRVLGNLQRLFQPRPAGRHRATCPSCRSTRASSTRRAPPSRRTRSTSTRRTSSSWRSRAAATRVASTLGVLGAVARKYAHKIPFIVKINHNELLTYPNKYDQIMFASVEQAFDMGAVAVGATIYFGSRGVAPADRGGHRGLRSTPTSWAWSRSSGATCATPPSRRTARTTTSPPTSPAQANHLGVTIEADIIKQKQPENNGGLHRARTSARPRQKVYDRADHRPPDRPLPLPGGQLLHGPRRADQLRRRFGRERPRRGRAHRRHQQARRRHGPDLRPQGLPEADGRGGRAAERHPGRLPGQEITVA